MTTGANGTETMLWGASYDAGIITLWSKREFQRSCVFTGGYSGVNSDRRHVGGILRSSSVISQTCVCLQTVACINLYVICDQPWLRIAELPHFNSFSVHKSDYLQHCGVVLCTWPFLSRLCVVPVARLEPFFGHLNRFIHLYFVE